MCIEVGFGLQVFEVDVLIGGSEHDLSDKATQDEWIGRLEDGDFDCVLLSPPCGTWSRANWANKSGPKPCRNRRWPWGIPHLKRSQQRRAENGNEFIHFSIRAITTAQLSRKKGHVVRCVLEHLEDLGRLHNGESASIWQLGELRCAFGDTPCVCVAGPQCRFPGVDRKKKAHASLFGYPIDGGFRLHRLAEIRFQRLVSWALTETVRPQEAQAAHYRPKPPRRFQYSRIQTKMLYEARSSKVKGQSKKDLEGFQRHHSGKGCNSIMGRG